MIGARRRRKVDLTLLSLQSDGNIPERRQGRLQMLNNLLLQYIRRREVIEIVQTIILEPEDIQ